MGACADCHPIRGDYDQIATNVAVTATGNPLAANLQEVARVTVPSLDRPVKLSCAVVVQNNGASGTNGDLYLAIAPVTGSNPVPALTAVGTRFEEDIGGSTTEPGGRHMDVVAWLDPDTPGDYILGALRDTGSDAVNILASSLFESSLWWERG